jgi:hypothetical protein
MKLFTTTCLVLFIVLFITVPALTGSADAQTMQIGYGLQCGSASADCQSHLDLSWHGMHARYISTIDDAIVNEYNADQLSMFLRARLGGGSLLGVSFNIYMLGGLGVQSIRSATDSMFTPRIEGIGMLEAKLPGPLRPFSLTADVTGQVDIISDIGDISFEEYRSNHARLGNWSVGVMVEPWLMSKNLYNGAKWVVRRLT